MSAAGGRETRGTLLVAGGTPTTDIFVVFYSLLFYSVVSLHGLASRQPSLIIIGGGGSDGSSWCSAVARNSAGGRRDANHGYILAGRYKIPTTIFASIKIDPLLAQVLCGWFSALVTCAAQSISRKSCAADLARPLLVPKRITSEKFDTHLTKIISRHKSSYTNAGTQTCARCNNNYPL